MTYYLKSIPLAVLAVLLSWATVSSTTTEGDNCLTCHDNTYKKSLNNSHIHPPFLDKKCSTCHIDEYASPVNNRPSTTTRRENRQKVTWHQKHYEPARTHFFLLPSSKVDNTLFIQTAGRNGQSKVTSIKLPPVEKLSQLAKDEQPPQLSNIQFLGVKRGILYSATIGWRTDEPSDAQIHYGMGNLNHKTRINHHLRTNHTINIAPVTPGKDYTYTVISTDMHGNKTVSQPLTFSTRSIGSSETSGRNTPARQSSFQEELNHQLSAVGEDYFITITANQPTHLSIGSHQELRSQIIMPANNLTHGEPVQHVIMKSSYDTNITSCLNCHKEFQDDSSHPINVLPKRGMIFPADLPLLDNGKMHCMTCHDMHSSDNIARIRRRTKQELCLGCHKNYD